MPDDDANPTPDQDDPFLNPDVISLHGELIEESAEEALNLGAYSDEEIAALVFEGVDRPVPLPWLDSLEPSERELAVAMGMRSLTVRGLVEALPLDDVQGTLQQTSPPEVWTLLGMRRHAPSMVVAERTTTMGTDWIVFYEQEQERWLAEFITAQGFHEFVLAPTEDTALALMAWSGVDPQTQVPEFDLRLTVDEVQGHDPRLEPVGQALVAVTLSRTDPAVPDETTFAGLYSGPEGSYLSQREADGLIRFRGEGFDAIEEFVHSLLQES
ncbi:hypothetical protein [Ornithinimicrobium pratense]|uniref:Uncharacterized protein n=1 Tax=Ornithinimicrobium pratense TaxID=2593973 RepID=A0A5J6V6Y5_9MICO|nr:hypothetical protein [Ornithinimicrobium pratense]QFG68896.1 hypothetical protein FY030_09445 [Ornithinimicrobium pratense]